MVTFEKIKIENDIIYYSYYPEGKNIKGIVSINIKTGEKNIVDLADNDKRKKYAIHVLSKLQQYRKDDNFKDKDGIAWY